MIASVVALSVAFAPPHTLLARHAIAAVPPSCSRVVFADPHMGLRTWLRNKKNKAANKGAEEEDKSTSTATATIEAPPAPQEQSLIERADELHAAKDVEGLFDLLSGEDPTSDDEIAWRMARAHHDLAEEIVGDDARKEKLIRDGLAIAEAAKTSSGSGLSLKWYAILLGRLGDFLPTKEKVANSFKIKESLEAAAALLPSDPSVQTALGQWCYKVAGISWVERNAAKLLFGAPPESSYEEALGFMLKSHDIRPSKKASLFAALCYDKLNQKPQAKEWAATCLELPSFGEADADIDAQAKKLA